MTFKDFKAICKNSLFPSFLKQLKANPETTFQQYIAKDHYEVPIHRVGDHPQTISLKKANVTASQTDNSSTDQSDYQMEPGDILIIYGTSSFKEAKIFGHCAIAISSNDILHMPGMNLGTQQWTKKTLLRLLHRSWLLHRSLSDDKSSRVCQRGCSIRL